MLKRFNIPSSVTKLLIRLSIVLGLLTVARLLFFFFNKESFQEAGIADFLIAIWFDIITISLFFFPFILISLIPGSNWIERIREYVLTLYFHLASILLYALNLMDIEYFKYTSKRSTFDLFTILGAGSDFKQLVFSFISDFWLIILLFIVMIIVHIQLYHYTQKKASKSNQKVSWKSVLITYLVVTPIFIILGRGGFQLKPVGIIEAAQYTKAENSALVLNTGFTMIKSYGKERLEFKHYFSEEKEKELFNPVKMTTERNILPDGTNLVVIILESFGNEFVGAYSGKESYTPFLDSLISESLSFEYAYANGKKSIEAVPAIIASIPSLMDNPYISSPYANNKIESLASILKRNGYSTGFFHGATNGSMRFDSFAAQAGYENYFGRFEYDNDAHFDRTWGILDEYFNPWTARKMTEMKQPFFGTLFTLSSHHPYYIPAHMKSQVKKGPQPICGSISYGDLSLKRFFDEAKKQPWFDNTLFVLCADHTPATTTEHYNQRSMMYRIPIVFYHPGQKLGKKKEKIIFQQLDIMPTALELLNVNTKIYSFGKSYYEKGPREAFSYLEGSHYYFRDNHMMTLSNDKVRNMKSLSVDKNSSSETMNFNSKNVYLFENRLKAIIQRYNRDLMKNQTTAK
jgi:phosphoglycerol transferase MdoB-like AlkP superfamily enzyme